MKTTKIEMVNQITLRMIKLSLLNNFLNFLILLVLSLNGEASKVIPLIYIGFCCGQVIVFVALIKLGANRRCKDPGLTTPQILTAVCVNSMCIYLEPEVGVLFLVHLFVIYMFGVLALNIRRYLVVWVAGASILIIPFYLVGERIGFPQSTPVDRLMLWLLITVNLGKLVYLAGFISNVRLTLSEKNEKIAAAYETMELLAKHDPLTGVLNRRALLEQLRTLVYSANRRQTSFCIAVVDLDHFKEVNDRGGHRRGDEVLTTFTSLLTCELREADHIARYGGDEFVVVLCDTDEAEACIVLERIRARVKDWDWSSLNVHANVSASIGVAVFHPGDDINHVLENADHALYQAKKNGRNCIHSHTGHQLDSDLSIVT